MKNEKSFYYLYSSGGIRRIRKKLENYVSELENNGILVHLPHRDTNQNATVFEICTGKYVRHVKIRMKYISFIVVHHKGRILIWGLHLRTINP